jgi:glycosyltransferase involved in cell wall biosynthesis
MNGSGNALVSIVIPCYNQARFLHSSVASARSQTCAPFEIIVVDDGSADDTETVACALGATVIRQRNAGVSAARNTGLNTARGAFVIFLDADDELMPDAVETGVQALTSNAGAVCAVGRARSMDAAGRDLPSSPLRPVVRDLYREWLSNNFVFTPGAAIFRREQLHAIGGFPDDVGPAADYAIYLQLARTGQVTDHGQPVVRYRNHPASMSRDSARMLRATMRVLRKEAEQLPAGYDADFRRGRTRWARWYGSQIIEWVLEDRRTSGLRTAHVAAVATLIRYCPSLVAARIGGRVTRAIRSPWTPRHRNTP